MPIYEYRCERGHQFEVMQRISDDPIDVCEVCESPVRKLFAPVAVHFKGSGFYNTDYGTRKRAREMNEAKEAKDGKSDSKDKSSDSKSTDSKSEAKESKGSKSESSSKKTEAKAA
jgi:putative FmdB family regulatory protein